MRQRIAALVLLLSISASAGSSHVVFVKYQGAVDLKHLVYHNTLPSSFVNGSWYDKTNKYMVVLLRHTYYGYCRLDNDTFKAFIKAPSRGRYYNAYIKYRFDCRRGGLPWYVGKG